MRNQRNLKTLVLTSPVFLGSISPPMFLPPLSDCTGAQRMGTAHVVTLEDGTVPCWELDSTDPVGLFQSSISYVSSHIICAAPSSSPSSSAPASDPSTRGSPPGSSAWVLPTGYISSQNFPEWGPSTSCSLSGTSDCCSVSPTEGHKSPGNLFQSELFSPQGHNLLKAQLTLLSARAHC